MNQAHVGLVIQLAGTALAAWALLDEWRSKPEDDQSIAKRSRRRPENPWDTPWTTKVPRVSRYDRQAYERANSDMIPRDRGTHPDILALAEWAAGVMHEHRQRAAKDWQRQQDLEGDLRQADEQLRQDQATRARHQNAATRRRVLIEMVGLVIVAIGTIVGSAA